MDTGRRKNLIHLSSLNKHASILLLAVLFLSVFANKLSGQCTVNSTGCGGYYVTVSAHASSIVPSTTVSANCEYGYNYEVTFTYTVTIVGQNTCTAGTVEVQPIIACNGGQSNGYYSIEEPTNATATTKVYSGSVTTSTNQYTSASNCATVTPSTLGCGPLTININGPGITSMSGVTCGTALPITLLSFDGAYNNDAVVLNWTSATEVNNSYYTIERTVNGNSFELLKKIPGAGNSSQPISYTAIDPSPDSGVNYYSLNQTDFDGNTNCIGIIPVTVNLNVAGLKVFPNPANNTCLVSFTDEKIESFQLAVYDYTGRQVLLQNIETAIGVNSTELNISSLPQGMYFITLPANGHLLKTKLIKE